MFKNDSCKKILWYINFPFLLILFFVCQLMAPAAYVVWYILLQPLRLIAPSLFWKFEEIMFNSFLGIVAAELQLSNFEVLISGDDWSKCVGEETLILPNHQCYCDIGALLRFFQGHGKVFGKTNWVMDWIAQFSPVGWTSKGHGDFFLLQPVNAKQYSKVGVLGFNSETCKNEMPILLQKNLISNKKKGKKWLILFAEGGFLRKRKASSQRYALKHDLPILEYVALPRVGAFKTIIDTLGVSYQQQTDENPIKGKSSLTDSSTKPLKWIVDLTIAYKTQESSVKCLLGYPQTISIHCRVIPAYEVIGKNVRLEDKENCITTWLFDLFENKNKLLENFSNQGCFVHNTDTTIKYPVRKCGVFPYWAFAVICLVVLGTWVSIGCGFYYLLDYKNII